MTPIEFAVKTLYWFFLYGFIGWGVEVVYAAIKTHKLVNRGFLCGPICPIYGFGMVGLIYKRQPDPDAGQRQHERGCHLFHRHDPDHSHRAGRRLGTV